MACVVSEVVIGDPEVFAGVVVVLRVLRQAENFREGGLGRMAEQGRRKGGCANEESTGPRPRRGPAAFAFLGYRDLVS
jgi:hypothetical protein